MKILIAVVGETFKPGKSPMSALTVDYQLRIARYLSCRLEGFRSEAKLMEGLNKEEGRSRPVLILADSRGQQVASSELAESVRKFQDGGSQLLVFAVGPANGWSNEMLQRADTTIAFGRITLPHELALVVLTEQVYRAFTILAGHPYHTGH